jgi:hypothetical protein
MTSAPVLALPNFSLPFVLECGVKASALSTYEKEVVAILESLKKWRHYFLGSKVIIKTGHQSLKFMTEQRVSTGIQQKLLIKLMEFNYTIEYKKGQDNRVADALSRKDTLMALTTVVTPSW